MSAAVNILPFVDGPTLNPDYNRSYSIWVQLPECGTEVECEECGEDLTGKPVYDRGAWLCSTCKEEYDANAPAPVVAAAVVPIQPPTPKDDEGKEDEGYDTFAECPENVVEND